MFVWSKVSPVSKQSMLEDQFLGLAQTNAVITELSGKKRFRIEVYCDDKNDAQKILSKFIVNKKEKFPNSEFLSKNGFYLPSYFMLKNQDIKYICKVLNKIIS